jgi:isoleucyl-tRNA synthetase
MRRIEDVLDVWFDSGSMPFAQVHYPFENGQWFATHSPADFIVEYIGQARGWFYMMHVLSTALFDRPAFKNVLSHGIVLGSDGQKMSKSLRNYPDVSEVFDRDGSDAMRWFLMSSSVIRGGNLIVTEEGIRESVRQFMLPIWSTYYFFTLYANAGASTLDAVRRTDSTNVLDRYLLAKTGQLVREVTVDLEAFDSPLASAKLRDFAEVLTNWYVRRSRERFWDGTDADAFDTLYTVLETVTRVAAPLSPLVMEEIWRGLTGGRSVHLTDWPEPGEFPEGADLVAAMDLAREIASAGLGLRKARGLRVRLPLSMLTVVVDDPAALRDFAAILGDELNVKKVEFATLTDDSFETAGVSRQLIVNARALGPRVGKDVQRIIQSVKAGDWAMDSEGAVTAGGIELLEGEFDLQLKEPDNGNSVAFLSTGGFVLLDTSLTPDLEAEGLARDVIRAIQDTRKAAGLDVSDRIRLEVRGGSESDVSALTRFSETIAGETLSRAVAIEFAADPATEAAVSAGAGSQRSVVEAGQYANEGVLVIDVWKSDLIDV